MRKKSMRLISAALAACMMASTLPVGAFALEVGTSDAVAAVSVQEAETPAEGIKINAANFPDPSFQKYVAKQFDTDQDGTLSQEEREAVTEIKISGKGCTSLQGIECFPNLKVLDCSCNEITALDVSQNLKLEKLNCESNNLTVLDLSNNLDLQELNFTGNPLTSMDVTNNQKLHAIAFGYHFYKIAVGEDNTFDLSRLPGNFDIEKVISDSWTGGTVNGTILTVDEDSDEVTYIYDNGCIMGAPVYVPGSSPRKMTVRLDIIHRHTYDDSWKYNDTEHWKECADAACPDKEGSVKDKAEHVLVDGVCECGYTQEIIDPGTGDTDYGGDIAAGVVIGGIAVVGAYEVGTGLYRITQMDDVAMPTNRLALAKLLWERAGKPEPESTVLYSDISAEDEDAQKAAHWAVEQELLNDDDSVEGELKFHPAFPVSKLRVCLTWENAKQKGLFDQNTEA